MLFSIELRDERYRGFGYSGFEEVIPPADGDLRLAIAFPKEAALSSAEPPFQDDHPSASSTAPRQPLAPLSVPVVPFKVAWVGLLRFPLDALSVQDGHLLVTADQQRKLCRLAFNIFASMKAFATTAGVRCPNTYDDAEYLVGQASAGGSSSDEKAFAPFTLEDEFGRSIRFRHGRSFIMKDHPQGIHSDSGFPILLVTTRYDAFYTSTSAISEVLERWQSGFLLYVTHKTTYDGLAPAWVPTDFWIPRLKQMLRWYNLPSPETHGLRPRHSERMSSLANVVTFGHLTLFEIPVPYFEGFIKGVIKAQGAEENVERGESD